MQKYTSTVKSHKRAKVLDTRVSTSKTLSWNSNEVLPIHTNTSQIYPWRDPWQIQGRNILWRQRICTIRYPTRHVRPQRIRIHRLWPTSLKTFPLRLQTNATYCWPLAPQYKMKYLHLLRRQLRRSVVQQIRRPPPHQRNKIQLQMYHQLGRKAILRYHPQLELLQGIYWHFHARLRPQRTQTLRPSSPQHAPHDWKAPIYGRNPQNATSAPTATLPNNKGTTRFQAISGTFL